jgi:hypothetical protein
MDSEAPQSAPVRGLFLVSAAVGAVGSPVVAVIFIVLGVVSAGKGNNPVGLFLLAGFFVVGTIFGVWRFLNLRTSDHRHR